MANTNVTIAASKVSNMPLPEQTGGFTKKFHIDYTDVNSGTGATDTVTMSLGSTSTNWVITRALAVVTTAFAGTTAFSITLGTTTSTNCVLAATTLLTAGVLVNSSGANVVNGVAACSGVSAITLQAIFTNATGGSPSALTAGAVDVFIGYYDPTKLDGPVRNA